jgi:hypothetical protein
MALDRVGMQFAPNPGMRTATFSVLLFLLPLPAGAATFAPVHDVDGDVFVELPGAIEALASAAGEPRRIGIDRTAFVRSLPGARGAERSVRLVAEEGVCDGHVGHEVLLGLYESMMEDAPDPESARWMLAAKVRGCQGFFSFAVLDPPADAVPRALGPTDEVALATMADTHRLLGGSRVLSEAREDWRPMFGEAEIVREAAWRAVGRTYALVDVVLMGGECGSTIRIRAVTSRDSEGVSTVVLRPARLEQDDEVVSISDLDGDGTVEIVTRRLDDAVRVSRLEGPRDVLLDAGEVPFFGCPC